MPDTIRVNQALGIIEIESFGKVSKEDIAGSIARVREVFEEQGINRVLVDTTGQESMPGTLSIYDLFSTFPQEVRVALLVGSSQATGQDLSFVETVSRNRRIEVKIFEDRDEALRWVADV